MAGGFLPWAIVVGIAAAFTAERHELLAYWRDKKEAAEKTS